MRHPKNLNGKAQRNGCAARQSVRDALRLPYPLSYVETCDTMRRCFHGKNQVCGSWHAQEEIMKNRVILLLTVALLSVAVIPAMGQTCDSLNQCIPSITNVATTPNTITVSFLQSGAHPDRINLYEGGTAQRNYADGITLASMSLAPLQNGGAITANNLQPNTSYQELHLCALFTANGFVPWCTDAFGAKTQPAGPPAPGLPTAPINLRVSFLSWREARLDWFNGNFQGNAWQTRIPATNSISESIGEEPNTNQNSFDSRLSGSTYYRFTICNRNAVGDSCASVTGTSPPQPPAPPILFKPTGVTVKRTGALTTVITWQSPLRGTAGAWLEVDRQAARENHVPVSNKPWKTISGKLSITTLTFTDDGAIPLIEFNYRVCTVVLNDRACSDPVYEGGF
jgi:hypothetical protein